MAISSPTRPKPQVSWSTAWQPRLLSSSVAVQSSRRWRAWDAALDYVAAHPEEANEIMARQVGGWLGDPAVFAETLKGVRLYDAKRNREYFGTPARPGQIYQTSQYVIDFWRSLGVLKANITPTDVIRPDLWTE